MCPPSGPNSTILLLLPLVFQDGFDFLYDRAAFDHSQGWPAVCRRRLPAARNFTRASVVDIFNSAQIALSVTISVAALVVFFFDAAASAASACISNPLDGFSFAV